MRRDKDIRQIALQISIALSAGVFSIMPSASAAPVLDHVVSGGAVVDQKTSPQVTDVTSNTRNNVIDWKDFSVSQGETVRFDKGDKINNYLNVVSGVNTSHIDGAIKGGDNVYIVNPNGVVFGNSASVDVGSLYVSSRPLEDVNYTKVDANGDMQPLADTASMKGGDIVNMGSVQANSVFVEGGNIIITDVDKIKTVDGSAVNNNVTIQTEGKITLARDINTIIAEQKAQEINTSKAKTDSISFASVADGANSQSNANTLGSNYTYTFGNAVAGATSINNESGLYNLATEVSGSNPITGDYILTADLDFTGKTFVPIGSASNVFSGNFDGQYHTVSGITVSGVTYGGLFGYTSGGTIENVGVSTVNKDGEIVGGSIAASYVGGIAGRSEGTTFKNVFNEGVEITGTGADHFAGGIVGFIDGGENGCEISSSYNTADVNGDSLLVGGIVGGAQNGVEISKVYNIGNVANGFVGFGSIKKISNAYTTAGNIGAPGFNYDENPTNIVTGVDKETWTSKAYYSDLDSISEFGYDGTEENKAYNTTWRIYEGQTLPLLRAFLTAHGQVKVNYEYTQGGNSASATPNDGKDITVVYNSKNIDISKVEYEGYQYLDGNKRINSTATGTKTGITVDGGLINAPTSVDGNVVGPVTATQDPNDPTKTIYTGKMKAAFYTGQQGYDLIGNNITINPRQVTINSSDVVVKPITKEYDSTNDASAALQNLSFGAASGIIDGDTTVSITPSADSTAVFLDSSTGGDAADVGNNKTVQVSASVTLKNADGYYNYVMADDAQATISQTITGNKITQKAVTINLNYDGSDGVSDVTRGINKEYDGTDVVIGQAYLPSEQINSTQPITYTYKVKDTNGNETTQTKTETLTIVYNDEANYEDSKAGSYINKVKYGGIMIGGVSGGKAKNYKLVDADNNPIYRLAVDDNDVGVNVEDGGAIYGTGHITKKNISSKGFSWYDGSTKMDATREYNRESTFTEYTVKDSEGNDVVINIAGKYVSNYDAVENTDYTLGSGETFGRMLSNENLFTIADVNGVADAGFITTLSKGGSAATDVTGTNGAQGVLYTVNVSQSAKDNYTIDNADITTDQITLVGKGSITPRTLNLVRNTSDDARAVKAYDGDAKVKRGTQESFNTINGDSDFLIYADNTDNKHHLLPGDENAVTITGKYYNGTEEDANVNYANGQVLDKKIVYTATVAGSNYIIVNKDTNTTTGTFTVDLDTNNAGMGRITQREIKSITLNTVSKTYDGNANVTNTNIDGDDVSFKTNDQITVKTVTFSDDTTLSDANKIAEIFNTFENPDTGSPVVEGKYGKIVSGQWVADEHASTTGGKTMQYTVNSEDGWLLKTDANDSNKKYKNYKLANNYTLEGVGTINKLTIAPEDIKLARNSKTITDVYDGTGTVSTPTQYLDYGDNNKAVWVVKNGKELNVDVNDDNVEAEYATIHSIGGTGTPVFQNVTYKITVDSTADYEVKDGNTIVSKVSVNKDKEGDFIQGYISPRPIIVAAPDNLTKTYDAKTAANTTGESLISIKNQLATIDQSDGRNNITAVYGIAEKDENGNITNFTEDKNASNTKGKDVRYKLEVTNGTGDDDGNATDYYFRTANSDTPITNIYGKGTINPLKLQVVVNKSPEKVFDGKSNVLPTDSDDESKGMPTFAQITFTNEDTDEDVRQVVKDDGFETNIGNMAGVYGYYDEEGNFKADSNVADKVVKYTGILDALSANTGGTNEGNYIVEDTVYGTGKITPATIDENAFKFVLKDNIIKTYSGDSAVAEYGMSDLANSAEVIDAFQRSWVDGGNDDKTGSGVLLADGTFIKLSDGAYTYTILQGDDAPKFTSGGQEAINAGAEKAYDVTYNIVISPESFKNYKYEPTAGSGLTENTPIPKTATTKGTIVKRVIEVKPANETLTKTYDGTTAIYNDNNKKWSGDTASGFEALTGENALKFTSGAASYDVSLNVQKGLIAGNNASTGAYTTADASPNADKTIVYTGKVMDGDTDLTNNYTFVGTTETTQNSINPFGISVYAKDINKTYDNTTNVSQAKTIEAFTGDVLGAKPGDSADAVAFKNDIFTDETGKYDNPNVKLDDGTTTHKVTYSGVALSSDNYKLVDAAGNALAYDAVTKTYSVEGKGTIAPLTLESIAMTADSATKVYDGNTVVKKSVDGVAAPTETDKSNNYITSFTVNGENWENNISYSAEYNNENVNDANSVTYTLGLGKKDNYIISANFTANGGSLETTSDGQYQWVQTHSGDTINPRELVVNKEGDISKVYDGTSTVKNATDKFTLSDDDLAVLSGDGISVNVEAKYVEDDGDTEHINAGDNIKVKYKVSLDGNTNGNYSLTGNEGTDVTGNITKRPVKISFDSSNGKEYDSTAAVTDKGIFTLEQESTDRGILTDDTGISVDTTGVNAVFAADGDVNRDNNGKVIAQKITYSGDFALTDNGNGLSGNYMIDGTPTEGEGVITPKKLKLTLNEQPNKEYDGNTTIKNSTIIGTTIANGNTALDNTAIETGDTINVKIASGAYGNAGAGTNKTYSYTVNWDNGNYVIVQDYTDTASTTKSTQIKGTNGIITPRELQVTVVGKAEKEYDGTEAVKNAGNYVVVNTDRIVSGDNIKLTVTGVYDNADAGKNDESDEPADHTVTYTLNLGNSNYTLDKYTATGDGVINRKTVTVEAKPVSVDVGQSMPKFSGSVKGLLDGENYLGSWLTYGPPAGVSTATPGQYAVYGWYRGNSSGVLGKNYIFEQSPANATAFTVNYVNNNTGNPDTKITPNNSIYHQISKDMNSGFGDNGAAAIEYKDKSGKVLGTEKIDSGEINGKGLTIGGGADMSKQADGNANIGIAGGDIVNMEGANAAGSVNVETTGDGTVVNLEVFSIGGDKQSGDNNSAAEITNTADKTYSLDLDNSTEGEIAIKNTNDTTGTLSSIAITDGKQNILGEEAEDKKEEQEKEGTIAIKSSNGEDDDEIELTVEKDGVNVA